MWSIRRSRWGDGTERTRPSRIAEARSSGSGAIADRYGHPVESVDVCCQYLDGSDLDTVSYDHGSLAEAEREFTALADEIEQIWNE